VYGEYYGYNASMAGGDWMHTVMESSTVAGVPTGSTGGKMPARITTTLYELIAAIQEVVDPPGRRAGGGHRGAPPDVLAVLHRAGGRS
jgi:hypothetical protein